MLPANGVAGANGAVWSPSVVCLGITLPVLAGSSRLALFLPALRADCDCVCVLLPKSKNFEPICKEPATIATTLAATNKDFTRFANFERREGARSWGSIAE